MGCDDIGVDMEHQSRNLGTADMLPVPREWVWLT